MSNTPEAPEHTLAELQEFLAKEVAYRGRLTDGPIVAEVERKIRNWRKKILDLRHKLAV